MQKSNMALHMVKERFQNILNLEKKQKGKIAFGCICICIIFANGFMQSSFRLIAQAFANGEEVTKGADGSLVFEGGDDEMLSLDEYNRIYSNYSAKVQGAGK